MNAYLPNVLITGGRGQLASAMQHHPLAKEFHLHFSSRDEMNITDVASIEKALSQYHPEVIINTAAYTAVDKAEVERDTALQINYHGADHLARTCKKNQLPLIHLSTDYVFDGKKNFPYAEAEETNPINFYGQTKYLAEQTIRQHLDQFIILRVSAIFSEYGHNFLKTILRLAQQKKELRIVADQTTCPTSAFDIATAIFTLVKNRRYTNDIYHYCSARPVSWYEFAKKIMTLAEHYQKISTDIKPITTAEYPTAAERPAYSVLSCEKIFNDHQITQPDWEKGLASAIKTLWALNH